MKSLIEIVSTITLVAAGASAAVAQTAQQHVENATAKAQSALAATGLPPWVWIVIAVVVLALIVLAFSRRRPKQTIIKTRLG
jgi:hypothetical protein